MFIFIYLHIYIHKPIERSKDIYVYPFDVWLTSRSWTISENVRARKQLIQSCEKKNQANTNGGLTVRCSSGKP